MCGICGVIQVTGVPRDVMSPAALDAMTDAMMHRGPSDRGTHLESGAALGVRRLSIIDVEGGHQPVANESADIWAIQNGELYNHDGHRDALIADGHRFTSRCDTEILPHLYERFGTAFPQQLRGKFGLAVWDASRRRAVIARDRLGVKPIYYAQVGDLLLFASELKSILTSGLVSVDLDYEAIDSYLTLGFWPGPRTPLAAVSKLQPGHSLVVENGRVGVERYWAYPQPEVDSRLSTEEYSDGLLEQLEESVRLRLMSDVPLGAMLSGGLDSSLVVALMARNMSEPVKTFSVGFAEDAEGNELADARAVAKHFGTEHHELELSFQDDTVELQDLVWWMEEPLADISGLGLLALCKLAAEHVTVGLSGQGADELLAGYRKHQAASLVGRWNRLPRGIRRPAGALALRGPKRFSRAARTLAAQNPVDRLLAMSGHVDDAVRSRLYRGPLEGVNGSAVREAIATAAAGVPDDPLPNTLHIDGQLALVDDMLHYFDRGSMAHSLELRVPFLDHHLVEYCARIPADLKVRGWTTKYLLRHAARGIVPHAAIDKPKRGFFRDAFNGWFRAQMRGPASDYLLGGQPRYAEFLDRGEVERMVHRHLSGEGRGEVYFLLTILMLEVWLSSFLPSALAPSSNRESIRIPA